MESGKVWCCEVFNEPLTNKVIKHLVSGRSPIEDLTAVVEIQEANSGKVIVPTYPPRFKDFAGNYEQRVRLPASWIHASFPIVFVRKGGGIVKSAKDDSQITFGVGKYKVLAEVIADNRLIKARNTFVVTDEIPYMRWGF
ncbi:hypothetical protein ACFLUN_01325 [Chloroflexota bacterium]